MKKGKRILIVIGALSVLMSTAVYSYDHRGLMGIWVNNFDDEGCSDESDNRTTNDDFYHDIRDRLAAYTVMYPELYPERTEYSEGNVWGPRLLEDWLEYQKSGSWYYGKDKNDDTDHTVLIISTHASIEEEDGDYWFRFLHQDNDREVDRTDRMTSEYQKCRTWWRNRNNWNRELIRMGSSSNSTSIGDGDTRWVIFHVCRSLQLTWDADEDYTVQDVWGWNDLSGGYRMIMGGSGHHHSNVGSAATTFVDRQYAQQWTFKQAWFDSMDGTFSTGSGQNDGRCVVYAKGGTTSAAQNTRDTDDFVYNINAAVPAASNQPDGWKSAWSSVNCENN